MTYEEMLRLARQMVLKAKSMTDDELRAWRLEHFGEPAEVGHDHRTDLIESCATNLFWDEMPDGLDEMASDRNTSAEMVGAMIGNHVQNGYPL
jgi:L-rhamnose isomerase